MAGGSGLYLRAVIDELDFTVRTMIKAQAKKTLSVLREKTTRKSAKNYIMRPKTAKTVF